MTETRHTPAPWEPVRSRTCGHLRAAHNYREDPCEEWSDADLTLIAAAPELLEALRDLHDLAEPFGRHSKYRGRSNEAFKRAAELLERFGG